MSRAWLSRLVCSNSDRATPPGDVDQDVDVRRLACDRVPEGVERGRVGNVGVMRADGDAQRLDLRHDRGEAFAVVVADDQPHALACQPEGHAAPEMPRRAADHYRGPPGHRLMRCE